MSAPTAPAISLPGAGATLFRGPLGVVPYIARWSSEKSIGRRFTVSGNRLAYVDERPEDRDLHSMLWTTWSTSPGVGEPVYDEMHPVRQRWAMRKLRCQVCAAPADQTDEGVLWLIQDQRRRFPAWVNWPEGANNTQPPVCLRCARISVKACPWLAKGYVAVRAQSVVSGAVGGLYLPGWPAALRGRQEDVGYDDLRIRWLQADQLTRDLVNCKIVELG